MAHPRPSTHFAYVAHRRGGPVSRSRRSRGNGAYESAVPITLSDLTLDVPAPLMALIEDASVTLAQFDDTAAHHLGEQVHTLGPMSAVLLRTEATSSSQIEHLTVGAKNLAMELLHEGNSENAAVVVGNVRAMESALRLSADLNVKNLLSMHKALLSSQPGWELRRRIPLPIGMGGNRFIHAARRLVRGSTTGADRRMHGRPDAVPAAGRHPGAFAMRLGPCAIRDDSPIRRWQRAYRTRADPRHLAQQRTRKPHCAAGIRGSAARNRPILRSAYTSQRLPHFVKVMLRRLSACSPSPVNSRRAAARS